MTAERLRNHVGGEWIEAETQRYQPVWNPATEEVLAEVPLGSAEDVERAVQAACGAYQQWRVTPPVERARYLFELRHLLEQRAEDLATIVTREHGKTLAEARGSVRRGIECVEVACGAPSLMMGQTLEDVARGIDCQAIRQPMGVFACIAPFNFPAMVPMWFFPFAVAAGNTFIVKPSEQVPLSTRLVFELIAEAGFPPGVLNLVNGDKEVVDAILSSEQVKGVSFVGSSPVAEYVYETAAAKHKRVQALGGAKNFMVVMPDADREHASQAIAASAFGCAGERCLSADLVATGEAMRQAVMETNALANWLRRRVGVVGLWGVSLGGWIAALSLTTATTIDAAVLWTPVADPHDAMWESPLTAPIRAALVDAGVDRDLTGEAFRRYSPGHRRLRLPSEDVVLIGAQFDNVANPESLFELERRWDVPVQWFPHGHISLTCAPRARRHARRALRSRLARR